MALLKEYDIRPDDIEDIEVGVNQFVWMTHCDPIAKRQSPRTPDLHQLATHLRYLVATAIIDRKVDLSHGTLEAIRRPDVLDLMQKIKCEVDPDIERDAQAKSKLVGGFARVPSAAKVQIKTKDGKSYSKRVDMWKGHSQNPLTAEELRQKFLHCAEYAARPLSKNNLEKALELLGNLEEVENVNQIVALLVA